MDGSSHDRDASVTKELWFERTCEMIDGLLNENEQLRGHLNRLIPFAQKLAPLQELCQKLQNELKKHEGDKANYLTTPDEDAEEKTQRIVDAIADFGKADFAELTAWAFASGKTNHRVVGQRFDEGSLLWRAVKMSAGPILEVGRDRGGSTLLLLGASGDRPVVSIDRAPNHAAISERIFSRPDVSRRLKLYNQTSREPIAESEFGLMFIDGDHSYEGVCHDIATFWNQLKPFNGKPPLAAFHDGVANPITFVPSVKLACDELLAEPGVARVVDTWGSMLVVEKLRDIDADRWYGKELPRDFEGCPRYWEHFANAEYPVLKPVVIRDRLRPDRPPVKTGFVNFLGEQHFDRGTWSTRGVSAQVPPYMPTDGGITLVRESIETGEHGVAKTISLAPARFNFCAFVRPYHLRALRLSVRDAQGACVSEADFELGDRSRIGRTIAKDGCEVIDASFLYRNGYFSCNLAVALPAPLPAATFAVQILDRTGQAVSYRGDGDRGFFFNLSSVREVL